MCAAEGSHVEWFKQIIVTREGKRSTVFLPLCGSTVSLWRPALHTEGTSLLPVSLGLLFLPLGLKITRGKSRSIINGD